MSFREGWRREGWDGWEQAKDRSEELFSPAGAVVLKLPLVQLHGQIWWRQWGGWLETETHTSDSYITHKHQISEKKQLTILFICLWFWMVLDCSQERDFLHFSWHLSFSPLTIYPSIAEAPPPRPHTCSAPSRPYGPTPFASGHGAAAVLQQASLIVCVCVCGKQTTCQN